LGIQISLAKPTPRSTVKFHVQGTLPPVLSAFLERVSGVKIEDDDAWVPKEPRLLELLLRDVDSVHLNEEVRTWYETLLTYERKSIALTKLEDMSSLDVDERLVAYQRVGVNFILKTRRCILADDSGMGKTAQAIEAIELSEEHKRILIVCTNSAKWWWKDEIEKWFPGQDRVVVEAATRKDDFQAYQETQGFLIINWELVRLMPELRGLAWRWIVADEAHKLKNRSTKTWKGVNSLMTRRLLLLTASPISNEPADLWALLHLLYPDRYRSYQRFYELYVNYFIARSGYRKINRSNPVRNVDLLQREIAPILLRRDWQGYRDTLPPQNKVMPLKLTAAQGAMYKTMAKKMYAILEDGSEIEVFNVGAKIVRLRQIVSTTATIQAGDSSSKLDAAVDIIENAPGEQFVVFALFRATVLALQKRLSKKKIVCGTILGGQPPSERYEMIKRFQEGEIQVIISTVQAGGESITLTASHQVIFIEKHYSYTVQQQAIGRVDRFGQTHQCLITTLHCPHTVDDLVEKIVASKSSMVDTVLRGKFFESLQDSLMFL